MPPKKTQQTITHDTRTTKPQRKLYTFTELHKGVTDLSDWYYSFQPTNVFRCQYILLWFTEIPLIKEITIGNIQQLAIDEIPGPFFAAPATLPVIKQWFAVGVLDLKLKEHHVLELTLNIARPSERFTMRISGGIHAMALYGTELVNV